jgi:hypothetical protein
MRDAAAVELPEHWHSLKYSEKFELLHGSPHLVRGSAIADASVDCGNRRIQSRDFTWSPQEASGFSLKYEPQGREIGSYIFNPGKVNLVTGSLEILSSDQYPFERIYVLGEGSSSKAGRRIEYAISAQELAQLASLFETYLNECAASRGQHLRAYVFLARRYR